ncbi:trehalose utilization protein [Paenibacillus sp. V4I3]|uniref:ThuA domain-containing protein n=1 Tax=unclassified Paenibacillus TaxID=185978 RepID=UPI00278B4F26|nr:MULTISPECIES: ThuA domain-containing protein [unclassified Paenibacillus]MDQ0877297.1 trehalose utilization protein [Paenibacillus sp. V4I3]MDQ0886836.1 trehalose utilization protein [Paenibacillus sp. V4I9]
MIKVTIWNEFLQEQRKEEVARIYPKGMHGAIADGIGQDGFEIGFATFNEPEHGLTQEKLDATDVLIYWGHVDHKGFQDDVVDRICDRVHKGMGLVVLHSGHHSKLFRKLMGTSCDLLWREADEKERLWVVDPSHPIVEGIGPFIDLPEEEMYGEHFDIPVPDELIFVSWFEGGEVFRSGCTYRRGQGRIFYFRPGHETYPTYHNKDVQRVIANAVKWTAPVIREKTFYGHHSPLEEIKK